MVWFGLVWFGLVWFGLVWFGLVWFGLVWFGRWQTYNRDGSISMYFLPVIICFYRQCETKPSRGGGGPFAELLISRPIDTDLCLSIKANQNISWQHGLLDNFLAPKKIPLLGYLQYVQDTSVSEGQIIPENGARD